MKTVAATMHGFGGSDVLTVDEVAHTVSVETASASIANVVGFAKLALNMQLDETDIVKGVDTSITASTISLSENIDLSGTGFTGFTRDNNETGQTESHTVFSKLFNGNNKTITLAIGEPYGFRGTTDLSTASTRSDGDGRIYNHRYNGLFGITNTTGSFKSVTLAGICAVSPRTNDSYVGALCGIAQNTVNMQNINVQTKFNYGGYEKVTLYLGRLVGELNTLKSVNGTTKSVLIKTCTLSGDVEGSHAGSGTCIGGVVGRINHTSNAIQNWELNTLTLSGKIENTAQRIENIIGGLIAKIEGYTATSSFKNRKLLLNGITISSEIKAGKATSMGGMLGYQWRNTDVDVGSSTTTVSINSGSKITASGAVKDMAGMVYNATGKWTVYDLDINAIDIAAQASNPRSFGMIVNKGWYTGVGSDNNELDHISDGSSSAIYMLLPTAGCYTITSATFEPRNSVAFSADVYDELVAYSAYYRDVDNTRSGTDESGDMYILQNGAGVVSVHTNSLVMNGTSASNSYQAQTSLGANPNPWTRYYYNLDTISGNSTAPQKLMSWGLKKYAHQSIKDHFTNPFSNNTFDDGLTYDMTGYSWYPIDVDESVTVKGTIVLDNYGFENSESRNGGTHSSQKSSLYRSSNPKTTQHFLMHAGLFRNVYSGNNVAVDGAALQGNVPVLSRTQTVTDGNNQSSTVTVTDYSGALICGTVAGTSDTNKAAISIDDLTLQGIYIHNIDSVSGNSLTYAPLIINKITTYTNLTAKNICTSTETNKTYTTNSFVPHIKTASNYPKAASSLIGEVGSSTAKGLTLNFTNIRLDGRTAAVTNTDGENDALDTAYGTERTIFTKATLLDTFQFDSGSTGSYTYTWENDWGADDRYVTYGEEVGYTTQGEFPNKERMYLDDSGMYTNPIKDDDSTGTYTDFDDFLPYVAQPYNRQNKYHQLEVNHKSEAATGCGTYNDPYMIQSGEQLENYAKILQGNLGGTKVILPLSDADMTSKWCSDKSNTTGHIELTYNNGNYVNGTKSVTAAKVREYVAGAYYKLKTHITLPSDFSGLGSSSIGTDNDKKAVFRGVIDGSNYNIINKSDKPLIVNSYGSVVRNLNITVDNDNIELTQDSLEEFPTCKSYGGVFGAILGGDNIIDNVSVTFSSDTVITLFGEEYTQLVPVGGFVGVIVNGGLFFRNMEEKTNCTLPEIMHADEMSDPSTVDHQTGYKWLYINPFIGRVINGFAVNESAQYHTSESTQTLKNGNKHYSITDIISAQKKNSNNQLILSDNDKMYVNSSKSISLPNAQSLFTLSLMVNSGMCIMSDYNSATLASGATALGYYTGNTTTRGGAKYDDINSDATSKDDCADYQLTLTDARWADQQTSDSSAANYAGNVIPYLIRYYTKKHTNNGFYARKITTQVNTITLSNTTTGYIYVLPDGFKGIGNFYTGNDFHVLKVSKLTGNNNTIDQNTSYYCYLPSIDNYPPYSSSSSNSTGNGKRAGLGLFNCQINATSNDGYESFTLTGKVQSDVYENALSVNAGQHVEYTEANINPNGNPMNDNSESRVISCGTLIGAACANIKTTDVTLKDIDIRAARHAGGLIGIVAVNKTTITVNNTSSYNKDWENIRVRSGANAGGMLGANMAGYIKVYFNNRSIKLNEIVSEMSEEQTYDKDKNTYYQYGLGGIVGVLRTKQGDTINADRSNVSVFQKLTVENYTSGTPATVGSTEYGAINTGGLVGMVNRSHVEVDGCTIKNVSCKANGYAGGLLGWNTTYSEMVVDNTHISTDTTPKAEITGAQCTKASGVAGGFVGMTGGSDTVVFTIRNSSIKNYTISGASYSGGVIGTRESSKSKDMSLQNFEISGCTIKASNSVGGIVGRLTSYRFVGYNILAKDLTFAKYTGTGTPTNSGYIVGYNNSKDIILVGFSRKGDMTVRKTVGNYNETAANKYGTNGYVIFADYNDAASNSSNRSNVFSYINSQNNVQDQTGDAESSVRITRVETKKQNASNNTVISTSSVCSYEPLSEVTTEQAEAVDGTPVVTIEDNVKTTVTTYKSVKNYKSNLPYVTSSPKGYIGSGQFLTGDGVSAAEYSSANFAFKNIINDKRNNVAGSYTSAPDYNATLMGDVTDHLSTSQEEYGDRTISNFPLLIVEDTAKDKVTSYINYYLRNLTNTTLDFAKAGSGGTNANKFKVALHKCVYDKTTRRFTVDPSESSASLKQYHRNGDYFQMSSTEIDNSDPNVYQFSLMDVQFYDPSTVNGTNISNAKVAYHLYVPIYVKKLIEYEFSAKLASGTNYYASAYSNINKGNTMFENLGDPVTMEIKYNYDRTTTDWTNAINGGESVLTNFYKGLQLALDSTGWNSSSRLVLVDANDNDKNYYLDSSFTNGSTIEFSSFTTKGSVDGSPSGTAYTPAPLNNLLDITFTPTPDGPLVKTTNQSEATVKDSSGNYYKLRPEDDTESDGYTATVTNIRPETYYLSIFTNKNVGKTNIYHYVISSKTQFNRHGTQEEDPGWKPNRIMNGDNYNLPVHLFIGNLYTNDNLELEVTPQVANTQKMSKNNYLLTVTMTAHVGLTQTANDADIAGILDENHDSTIYQTFLMNYKTTELVDNLPVTRIGVDKSAISSITVTSYKIYHGATASGTGTTVPYSDPEELMTSNYIELRNNQNLNEYLRDSTEGHNNMATIQVTFAVEYSEKNLSRQFPERGDEIDTRVGAQVFGYSNISSTVESGAYSATSEPAEDVDNNGDPVRYYTKSSASASLTYNAEKTMTDPNGQYSSLGINPFDEGTKDTNKGHIDSTATYSFLDIQNPTDYIEFNITLTSKKNNNYGTPLDIRQYFQNLTIKADKTSSTPLYTQGTDTSTTNVVASMSSDGTRITLRAKKDSLKKVADKVYSIYVSFDVLTGDDNGFGDTKAYSNYKVNITADMYSSLTDTSTPDQQHHASDHIIYTNSKLQYRIF